MDRIDEEPSVEESSMQELLKEELSIRDTFADVLKQKLDWLIKSENEYINNWQTKIEAEIKKFEFEKGVLIKRNQDLEIKLYHEYEHVDKLWKLVHEYEWLIMAKDKLL